MPPDLGVTDFGLLPRDRYPLVAVLTLANSETRDNYNIVSSWESFITSFAWWEQVKAVNVKIACLCSFLGG